MALALASDDDGAVMEFRWCNRAFTQRTSFSQADLFGQRGTILIAPNTNQGTHLFIIDKLMNWRKFSVEAQINCKSGESIPARMMWTPISDPDNGQRWWLCTLREDIATPGMSTVPPVATAAQPEGDLAAKYSEELVRLERENGRLRTLARTVTRESNEDSLTGLSNRRHFEVELRAWVASLRGGGPDFAVLYIDLDRFKSVNDTLGHSAGDALLVSVSLMLKRLTRDTDLVARLGGDEFVVLRPLDDSALSISGLADEIVHEMAKPFEHDGKSVTCSASVGVAIADARTENPEQIVGDADTALYHAKANGRARWSFFTADMHANSVATRRLATELLVACDNHQFIPYFQPLIDARTGQIASAEVLVRWRHTTRGLLPPIEFLSTAAKMGILGKIDAIVFQHLRDTLHSLPVLEAHVPRFGINVSAGRLADPNLIHDIRSSGLDPSRLSVEILESVYLERIGDPVRWALEELRELGVTLAVDDFGTGHASVQGLLQIRPDVLKIDRQFIQPVVESESARALVVSLIGIGQCLGMKVVAEGVESDAHARIARDMGCDYLQGFHFGRPMSAQALYERLMETGGRFWQPPVSHTSQPQSVTLVR